MCARVCAVFEYPMHKPLPMRWPQQLQLPSGKDFSSPPVVVVCVCVPVCLSVCVCVCACLLFVHVLVDG